jgi:archaellum component FlaC
MELYKELKELVSKMEQDIGKFYNKGNHQASIRVRKELQEVKRLAQMIRKDISITKKTMPPKKRKKKEE